MFPTRASFVTRLTELEFRLSASRQGGIGSESQAIAVVVVFQVGAVRPGF